MFGHLYYIPGRETSFTPVLQVLDFRIFKCRWRRINASISQPNIPFEKKSIVEAGRQHFNGLGFLAGFYQKPFHDSVFFSPFHLPLENLEPSEARHEILRLLFWWIPLCVFVPATLESTHKGTLWSFPLRLVTDKPIVLIWNSFKRIQSFDASSLCRDAQFSSCGRRSMLFLLWDILFIQWGLRWSSLGTRWGTMFPVVTLKSPL